MENLLKKYDEIINQRKAIITEMKSLENESLKKYFNLKKQNESLYVDQLNLYKDIKMNEYESCNHILVYSKIDYDYYEGRTYKSCGCIKCGLDNSLCDIDLAQAIYKKIKSNYPNIDDAQAIKFFKVSLKNIRNIKVNDERKVSRAKRLALSPDFAKWDSNKNWY